MKTKSIRVYNQVFRIEKTVYSIQGVQLPIPVSYRQLAFFAGSLFLMIILNLFPPFNWVDYYLIKFIAIPAFIAWFFTSKTLDGKVPHRFLHRYIEHAFSHHLYSRYKKIEKPRKGFYQFEGDVAYRIQRGGERNE